MAELKWRLRDILLFTVLVFLPMLAEIGLLFAGVFAAIISVIMARIFVGICIRLLPFYARRQASKGRFLIRFSNPITDVTMTRKRKARIALSHAWVPFAFCVFIASSAITFQGFEGAATGEGLEFYKCSDGEEILFSDVGDPEWGCSDGSDLTDPDPTSCTYPECTGKPVDRVLELVFSAEFLIIVMLSPLIAFLTAPLLIIKESTIAVVDKEDRSITPIGANAYRMLNAVFGFGAFIILSETSWSVAQVAANSTADRLEVVFVVMFMIISLMLIIFHILWIYSYLYANTHIKFLSIFEEKLTNSQDIELHTFNETNPGILSVEPS